MLYSILANTNQTLSFEESEDICSTIFGNFFGNVNKGSLFADPWNAIPSA